MARFNLWASPPSPSRSVTGPGPSERYSPFDPPSAVEPGDFARDPYLLDERTQAGDSIATAIARHKLLVLLVGIVLTGAGAAIGLARAPTYTASTTLQVGTANVNSPGFYGFVQSASALATVFSRSITAEPVLAEIKSKLGVGASEATQRLSAEPIPVSPSFRVIATGSSARAAEALANITSAAVIVYSAHSASTTSPPTAPLLANYRRAAQTMQDAAANVARLQRGRKSASGEDAGLIRARSELDSARVHAEALGAAYRSALVSAEANPSSTLLSLVAGAATASSDRSSKTELFAFTGLLAGLVLGAALAALYEQRRMRSQQF